MVVRVYWKCRGGSEHVKGSSSRGNEQRRTALGGPQSGIYTGVNQGAQCASASQHLQDAALSRQATESLITLEKEVSVAG